MEPAKLQQVKVAPAVGFEPTTYKRLGVDAQSFMHVVPLLWLVGRLGPSQNSHSDTV